MKDFITINRSLVGNKDIATVDARELHVFLEVKTIFAAWITRKIDKYQFKKIKILFQLQQQALSVGHQ